MSDLIIVGLVLSSISTALSVWILLRIPTAHDLCVATALHALLRMPEWRQWVAEAHGGDDDFDDHFARATAGEAVRLADAAIDARNAAI